MPVVVWKSPVEEDIPSRSSSGSPNQSSQSELLLRKHDPESLRSPNRKPDIRALLLLSRRSNGSFLSGSISLLKTILGAGMLAMPAAIATVGYVPGVVLILVTGLLSSFSLHLYAECAEVLGPEASLSTLSSMTYPSLSLVFDAGMAAKCAGVCISFLVVIQDMLPSVAGGVFGPEDKLLDRHIFLGASLPFVVPLSMKRSLESLRFTSMLGLVAVIYMVCLSLYHFGYNQVSSNWSAFVPLTVNSTRALAVFIFAFTCHQNIFSVHNSVTSADASPTKMSRLINTCVCISAVIYLAFSSLSYCTFGSDAKPNVFLNYPNIGWPYFVGRLAFVLLAVVSFPLMLHPCRKSLLDIYSRLAGDADLDEASRGDKRHYVSTVLILAFVYVSAWIVQDLSLISALIGTIAGIPICYILPGIFYTKIMHDREDKRLQCVMSEALGVGGVLMIVACFYGILAGQG